MSNPPVLMDYLKVIATRKKGVLLTARIQGEDLAYQLTTEEARNMSGALEHLAPGTADDYFSITDTLHVVSTPDAGVYLEAHIGELRVELPLDQRGALQIASDLERSATAYEFAVMCSPQH